MAVSYTNISMTGWNELSDQFNNSQLNDNFKAINEHNHTGAPKGLQIPTAGLASEAVTSEKISSEAITEAKYKNASITGSKIKTNTINYGNIMSEGLRTENYAKESITGEKLGEGTVTTTKIAKEAVTAEKLGEGTITQEIQQAVMNWGSIEVKHISAAWQVQNMNGTYHTGEVGNGWYSSIVEEAGASEATLRIHFNYSLSVVETEFLIVLRKSSSGVLSLWEWIANNKMAEIPTGTITEPGFATFQFIALK